MRVTPPVEITTTRLTSSSAAEPHAPAAYNAGTTYAYGDIVSVAADFAIYESLFGSNTGNAPSTNPTWWRIIGTTETAYNAGTTYGLGDTVSSSTSHRCYESLAAGNLGNPLPVLPETLTTKWMDVGPTNRYAMFDLSRNTQTVCDTSIHEVMTLDVAPATAWAVSNTITGQTSSQTCVVVAVLTTKTFVVSSRSGAFTLGEVVGVTGVASALATQGATRPIFGAALHVVITPGERVNALGLAGLSCNTVQISATSAQALTAYGNATIYPNALSESTTGIFDINTRIVNDGYDYAFEPFTTRPSMSIFDIPPFSDAVITVTMWSDSGNVKCGALVVGTYIYIGDIRADCQPSNDGLNFSSVTRDNFGNATLVPRRTIPKTEQRLTVVAARVNKVKDARVLLNATPALWSGLHDNTSVWFDAFTILGIYTQFQISGISNGLAEISLGLEEI